MGDASSIGSHPTGGDAGGDMRNVFSLLGGSKCRFPLLPRTIGYNNINNELI